MKKISPYLLIFLVSVLLAILNFIIIKVLISESEYQAFYYSIPALYCLFFSVSVLLLMVQKTVQRKNPEQIGYVFLLLSSVKMLLCYGMLYPVLEQTNQVVRMEKINFFIVFIVFLAIDVFVTSGLLKDVGKKD